MDVVVVGAGPVGLLTAVELTLGGASVIVLERLEAPSQVTKALGMGPLGCEALQRRGMGGAMAAQEGHGFVKRDSKIVGHFAGLSMIRRDAQREPDRRFRMVDQQSVEAMLAERARGLGIEVRRGCEVSGLVEREDGVEVSGIRCAYLVGCDGGRSTVRKLAGFEFPGTDPSMTMYTAVVDVDRPELLVPPGWNRTSGGAFSYGGPFPRRLFMLDFSGPPEDRQAPVTAEEVEAVLRRVSLQDVRVTGLETGSRWADNTRLVDSYRRGRVLLAGDAAHIHSPFGGQGMSLGLVDASNLGWKLAAVVRGEMPESLLDTYTAERRPVAEAVLANTLAQAAILRPEPQAGAMREIVANLMQFDDVNRYLGEMMSGLSVRYDLGSERDEVGRLIGDRPTREGSLYELMRDGGGVFLDASGQGVACGVRCVGVDSGPSMLIRPDGCVAWAGGDGLEEALARWFPRTALLRGSSVAVPKPST